MFNNHIYILFYDIFNLNKCKNGRMQGNKCICPIGTELIKDECKVE